MAKPNIVLDMSMLDMFLLCEARFNYRYKVLRVAPARVHALDRGSLIHIGCEYYYKSLQKNLPYEQCVENGLMKVRELGATETNIDSDLIRSVLDTLEENWDYWRFEDQLWKIEAVEQPFIIKLHEDDVMVLYVTGKIDLLISNNQYTNLPVDHKSYERERELVRLSNQFQCYCYATGSNYILVNRIGLQKTLKAEQKYKRPPLSYDNLMLDEWKQNVIKVAYRYLTCIAEDSWLMNTTSCDKYNRKCEYLEVCESSGKEAKLYKLENNYVEAEKWDVSKALKGE